VSVCSCQGFGGSGLVLFGHLRIDGRGLDAGVAELLLNDFTISAVGSVEVGGKRMTTRVGRVPGIEPHGRHEVLHHPPDPIPGKGAWLPGEYTRPLRDILAAVPLPRQERLQMGLEFPGDEDLALLVSFALADNE